MKYHNECNYNNKTLFFLLQGFLIYIILYHITHTFVVYGQEWLPLGIFSSIKDIIFLGLLSIAGRQIRKKYDILGQSFIKLISLTIVIITIFLLISWFRHISFDSILVGFKYDLWWMIILLGSIFMSIVINQEMNTQISNDSFLGYKFIFRVLWFILIFGAFWQLTKIYFPDIFTWLGYGPIGDYSLGNNPPIWYRTGPGGWMRFSGIFSGPNNFAYLLVAFFPLVFDRYMNKNYGGLLSIAMIIAILATMSRAAIGAVCLQIIILLYIYKGISKKYILSSCLLGIWIIIGLLIWKRGSTVEHATRFLEGFKIMWQYPLGLGLGVAGPSIHYHGLYLPENQYLQRIIDGGILGCIGIFLWLYVLYLSLGKCFKIWNNQSLDSGLKSSKIISLSIVQTLSIGFLGILVIGFFLHSFEDSMVNYLFFIIYGFHIGILINKI